MKDGGVVKKDLIVRRRDVSYLKYIMEGYEGLATVTTIDRDRSVVRLSIVPDFVCDVNEIVEALKKEIDIHEVIEGEEQ